MAITNGYCTLAEFYGRYEALSADSGVRDGKIEDHIEAASRWIDRHCMRQFYATTATRYFTAGDAMSCNVSDILTVTTLKTDHDGDRTYETTWEQSDYDLMPYNNAPYQWLEITPQGAYFFPFVRRGVEIAGTWGYVATTPEDIKEACLMQASRLFARESTVLGEAGRTALGTMTIKTQRDEDIHDLLRPFVKREIR